MKTYNGRPHREYYDAHISTVPFHMHPAIRKNPPPTPPVKQVAIKPWIPKRTRHKVVVSKTVTTPGSTSTKRGRPVGSKNRSKNAI